jgi:hypothetical protein
VEIHHLCDILDILIFGGGWSRIFLTKHSLSGHVDFFPKKSQVLSFRRDMVVSWNIQIFGYLNIRTVE